MRILWLHQYFSTPNGWGAVRTYELARRFVANGDSVDVLCCGGYDAWLLEQAEKKGAVEVEGIRVFVSRTAYGSRMSFLQRICSFLKFMLDANWFVLRHGRQYDLCIASSGPLTMAVPALIGRVFHKLSYVFEVIDVWPDSAIDAGVLRNSFLQKISFLIERLAYKYAEAIVTCSTGMTDRVINKLQGKLDVIPEHRSVMDDFALRLISVGQRSYRVQTISNSCDLEQFKPDATVRQRERARLGVNDDQLVVLYSGAMGVSNQIDDLIAVIHATQGSPQIVWWLAGDGLRADDLKALAESGRVCFCGQLSKNEVARLYQGADVNLVTFMHTPLFYENSPNKFFDGIAAGLPALFNRSTWLEPWLNQYGCGVVCSGDQPGAALAQELQRLANDPRRLSAMRAGALQLAARVFSRDQAAASFRQLRRG
ncbi:MAG: glycosyltransferase family 4 protein [Kiritimatiellae bacterium]|nr:glycosyltransferase family 4 protein [Kiritimatiellia bacterium]